MEDISDKNLENTRPMARINPLDTSEESIDSTSKVRELAPLAPEELEKIILRSERPIIEDRPVEKVPLQQEKKASSGQGKLVKMLGMFLGVFLLALFLGVMAAGYLDEEDKKKEALLQQQYKADAQLQELEGYQERLLAEKKEIELKQQELLEEQKKVEELATKNNEKDKSTAKEIKAFIDDKLLEKSSPVEDNRAREPTEDSSSKDLAQSAQEVENALQEVNSRLEDIAVMHNRAMETKASLEASYLENKGLIDKLMAYFTKGVSLIRGI